MKPSNTATARTNTVNIILGMVEEESSSSTEDVTELTFSIIRLVLAPNPKFMIFDSLSAGSGMPSFKPSD